MSDSTVAASASKSRRLNAAVPWVIGLVLVLGVAPLVRARVSMSDELDLYSMLLPVWTLLQLALFAGALSWLRVHSTGWSVAVRAILAFVIALIIGVLQPVILTSISTIIGSSAAPLAGDPLQAALLAAQDATLRKGAAARQVGKVGRQALDRLDVSGAEQPVLQNADVERGYRIRDRRRLPTQQ